MAKKMKFTVASENIFSDFFDEPKASELKFRSGLMILLKKYMQHKNITPKEAAKHFGVSQACMSNLVHGRIDLFNNDMLIAMLEKAGFKIYEKIQKSVTEMVDFPKIKGKKIIAVGN